MRQLAVAALLASTLVAAAGESQIDAAVHALRKDSSLKVRTQAAVVLGQRGAVEAVPALREAIAADDASVVRLAAVVALGKIRDRSARPALRNAADADPDDAVRKAARRALDDLGPLAFSIEEAQGGGSASTRDALRQAIVAQLKGRGFAVLERGGVALKPSIMKVDVEARGGKTTIAVKAALVAVDDDGKMAAMLESGAKLTASGVIPDSKVPIYAGKALEAAARTLCDDLAAKLGER
jgi:hypothetical protein